MSYPKCLISSLFILFCLLGCSSHSEHSPSSNPTAAHQEGDHHHAHEAPHQGTLVVLGDEFAHLEFVLDSSKGELTLYVLDGEARDGVRLEGGNLSLQLVQPKQGEITLSPVADELTGETVESTSKFSGNSDLLIGVEDFEGTVSTLTVKGQEFSDVKVNFPEGNESGKGDHEDEHHDEEHHH